MLNHFQEVYFAQLLVLIVIIVSDNLHSASDARFYVLYEEGFTESALSEHLDFQIAVDQGLRFFCGRILDHIK